MALDVAAARMPELFEGRRGIWVGEMQAEDWNKLARPDHSWIYGCIHQRAALGHAG